MSRRGQSPRTALWVVLGVVVAIAIVAVVAVVLLRIWIPPAPKSPPLTASERQSLAVATFLKAWVKNDSKTMEKLVTPASIPWTAGPPALPPGVSTDTVASFIEPFRENGQVVIGNPLVIEIRMTGNGKEPTGTVTARITTRKQAPRTVHVRVVKHGGTWLIDSIDGVPAVKAVKSLTQ